MGKDTLITNCLGLVLASSLACAARASVLGVQPSLAHLYSGDTFKCLSGTESMPAARLNDDVCDCADGSDEPGAAGHVRQIAPHCASPPLNFSC